MILCLNYYDRNSVTVSVVKNGMLEQMSLQEQVATKGRAIEYGPGSYNKTLSLSTCLFISYTYHDCRQTDGHYQQIDIKSKRSVLAELMLCTQLSDSIQIVMYICESHVCEMYSDEFLMYF